jgi:CheY-like chemotaxis protein
MVKKIMIVDDNSDVITSVKYGLEDQTKEYQVIGADSGKQCLALLEHNQKPDLIFLDIMMPEMSGWETFEKIRENDAWRNIPVVFLTARTDNTAKKAGKLLGDDYLEKPFEIKDILNCINKLLKKQ